MDTSEFIDKILTPLGGGLGFLLAFRLSSQLKKQPIWVALAGAASVTLVLGAFKWLA